MPSACWAIPGSSSLVVWSTSQPLVDLEILVALPVGHVVLEAGELVPPHREPDLGELLAERGTQRLAALELVERLAQRPRQRRVARIVLGRRRAGRRLELEALLDPEQAGRDDAGRDEVRVRETGRRAVLDVARRQRAALEADQRRAVLETP